MQEIYLSKLIAYLEPLGYGENIWRRFECKPVQAVTFDVDDIFVQTSGPGAGEKIEVN